LITSDVTVDYSAPLPCGLVPFPRIRTLAKPEAGVDGELLDLLLHSIHKLSRYTHHLYIQGNQKPIKMANTAYCLFLYMYGIMVIKYHDIFLLCIVGTNMLGYEFDFFIVMPTEVIHCTFVVLV